MGYDDAASAKGSVPHIDIFLQRIGGEAATQLWRSAFALRVYGVMKWRVTGGGLLVAAYWWRAVAAVYDCRGRNGG